MADTDPHHLGDEARAAVLGRGGVGVLSFSTDADEPPHALPVSYGYDAESEALYFRLAVGGESTKADLLENPATFVVSHDGDDGYESVVASGHLDDVNEADVAPDVLDSLARVDIPLFDVFEREPREVAFAFYRMDASDATGKRELQRLD